MLYVTLFFAIALVIHLILAPRKYIVHASRAKSFPHFKLPYVPFLAFSNLRGRNGERIPRKGLFFGEAHGSSMKYRGINDGASFYGRDISRLPSKEKLASVGVGDVVVVHGPAQSSKTGYRLREIDYVKLDEGLIAFKPSADGKQHRQRTADELVSIVEGLITD